jgi:hypothetical protein
MAAVATHQQSIRIPRERWRDSCERARRAHSSSGAAIINAFLLKYQRGELDAEVSRWLEELTGVPHPARSLA